jgi:hypothetical protein
MRYIIAILLSFISALATAQGVVVKGNMDCGAWLDARERKLASNMQSMIVGYVDGLAVGRSVEIWYGKNPPVNEIQLYFWMDEYCRKKPLSSLSEGAFEFANEMTNGRFIKSLKK